MVSFHCTINETQDPFPQYWRHTQTTIHPHIRPHYHTRKTTLIRVDAASTPCQLTDRKRENKLCSKTIQHLHHYLKMFLHQNSVGSAASYLLLWIHINHQKRWAINNGYEYDPAVFSLILTSIRECVTAAPVDMRKRMEGFANLTETLVLQRNQNKLVFVTWPVQTFCHSSHFHKNE